MSDPTSSWTQAASEPTFRLQLSSAVRSEKRPDLPPNLRIKQDIRESVQSGQRTAVRLFGVHPSIITRLLQRGRASAT